MLTKETFCNAIIALKKQKEKDHLFAEKLSELFPLCYSANMLYDNDILKNNHIKVLKEAMNDKSDWIEYFCDELDFGAKNKELKVFDGDVKEIPLTTPEDLYNLLVKDYSNPMQNIINNGVVKNQINLGNVENLTL